MKQQVIDGVDIRVDITPEFEQILTPQALAFLVRLHREFNGRRKALLQKRVERQKQIDAGANPGFLPETEAIRQDASWKVAPTPADLQKRWVEITGPTERKMLINALNSGANIFMADFEDSLSPTWHNVVEGQVNLRDAIDRTISFTGPDGKKYALKEQTAVLMVRPRGWHLYEKHVYIDGEPISGSLFDFGLYLFHNGKKLLTKGTGPYFYLPKLESHLEARLWNDVFNFAQESLNIPKGSIRATVLIETILAAFEMDEILYELRHHSAGLNAGRWDYTFSIIKKFHNRHDFVFPDRSEITMTVPFMRAYTELLIQTCHKRGAHAMGGMAAFIPSRKDTVVNEVALKKVTEDKQRESTDGFDGTWVAHPDLVPVAMTVFQTYLGDHANQKARLREEVHVTAKELQAFHIEGGRITDVGVRHNISIAVQYIGSWLRGVGAAAIFNLMEDAATAEISRAQLWQWIHSPNGVLDNGQKITVELFRKLLVEELGKIRTMYGDAHFSTGKYDVAAKLLDQLVTDNNFQDFLTIPAYELLN